MNSIGDFKYIPVVTLKTTFHVATGGTAESVHSWKTTAIAISVGIGNAISVGNGIILLVGPHFRVDRRAQHRSTKSLGLFPIDQKRG
ncbi:MAG: hypothetical protein LBR91_00715 [Puniceicoccales bacterium]|nr:hypothetical protein [Puniceicoccales bacterium]